MGDDENGDGETSKSRKDKLASKLADLTPEDRKKIEKMYYKMRKYGCRYCPVR